MDKDLDKLLHKHTPEIQALALQARRLIQKTVPQAREKVILGWRVIWYSFDGGMIPPPVPGRQARLRGRTGGGMKTSFCALGPLKGYVNIYISRGADLKDPTQRLEGNGKKMRHVKIKGMAVVKGKALKKLIQDAAALHRPAPKRP